MVVETKIIAVGDWVYCDAADVEFMVTSIYDGYLHASSMVGYRINGCTLVQTEECPRCKKTVPDGQVYSRSSFGVYAGKFCDACCSGYTDNCGLDGSQGNPQELDECVEPEDYY